MWGIHITGTLSEQDAGRVRQRQADAVWLAVKYTGLAGLVLAAGKVLHWLRWW